MKLIINHGFVLILMVIFLIFIMAIADIRYGNNNSGILNSFSGGLFFGMILVSGIFMLRDNTIIEYKPHNKRKKWKVYTL